MIDAVARSIFRQNADTGRRKELVTLPDDTDPSVTPHIAVSPAGDRLAFTCGRAGGMIDLALIEFDGAQPVSRICRSFSNADYVLPFWSSGGQIACLSITHNGSDILAFPAGSGDGNLLYQSDHAEVPIAPASSSTGKFIAFVQAPREKAGGLVLLDCDTQQLLPLTQPKVIAGRLAFGDETLSIQGASEAVILWLHISHKREPVERF